MKFLRKFNENLEDRLEIKDYCEMNLAYLIDEGFFIDVHSHSGGYYNITLRRSLTTTQHGVVKLRTIKYIVSSKNSVFCS